MNQQLALNLQLPAYTTFTNFWVSNANNECIKALQSFSHKQGEWFIYCWGNAGVGKTHLLQACVHEGTKHGFTTFYLDLTHYKNWQPDILNGLENIDIVCLDNIEKIAGEERWEKALFNLYNLLQTLGNQLLLSANASPTQIKFDLKDLHSRISNGLIFHIHTLSDNEKKEAIKAIAHRHGLELADKVANYLLLHYVRNMKELSALIEKLDHISLKTQRRLTIPLVKLALEEDSNPSFPRRRESKHA